MKLVTVIMPCYNMERFLKKAIDSVVSQTYGNLELIIIDDCSEDTSSSIASCYSKRFPWIKLVKTQSKGGPSKARNLGYRYAQGDFIAFLDSDDVMLPSRIEKQVALLTASNSSLCYSSYYRVDGEENFLGYVQIEKPSLNYDDLLGNPCICISTLMVAKFKIDEFPLFDIRLKKAEDYYFYLTLIKEGYTAMGIPEPLVEYRVLKGSLSRQGFACLPEMYKIYTQYEKKKFLFSCELVIRYLFKAAKRRSLFWGIFF